ncbi:MAG TPA: YtxH domain-containing protein [Candidatus Saccharibacteria bacterium]|nr:YtxH domain-containing protein [Candidatus Saccharibacteria bacterium]HMR38215.1 YtxH domain-containing protein [Candidatus Saccharibacteria bacterium]
MSKGKFALGAIIGAAVGVIAGFLTAPKSGKETREDIKKKAGELKQDADKMVEKTKQEAGKVADTVNSTVKGFTNRAGRAVESAKQEFQKEAKK